LAGHFFGRASRKRCRWQGVFALGGISVEVDAEKYPHGRFARLYDPEGNASELWEPAGCDGV
jgi:hypothetical protein